MANQPYHEPRLEESVINAAVAERSGKAETIPLFFGMALVIVSTMLTTYVVGANWGWWGKMKAAMKEAGVVIHKIPKSFGDWEAMTNDEELDRASIEQLELTDYVVRRYVSQTTGETVSLIFMIGPTGRLTAHTPQICFGARNFTMDSLPTPISFPYEDDGDPSENKDAFSKIVFKNQSVSGGAKLFYYGVSAGKKWVPISNSTRADLHHYRFLYKLQLEAFVPENHSGENDVIARFLKDFLPTIRSELATTL